MADTPATVDSSVDSVRTRVDAAGLVVERAADGATDGFWAYAPYLEELTLPAQGFKLHISATIVNAGEVADRLLPLLMARRIGFKCVSSSYLLSQMNQGSFGLSQVGKFMTIYPVGDADAVALARELHELLTDFRAPEIPSDFPLHTGSLVHYRFGVIGGHRSDDDDSPDLSQLALPDGSYVRDARDPRVPVPEWVTDPFVDVDAHSDIEPTSGALFAGRFIIHDVLRQRGKGGVYRALEVDPDFVALVAKGVEPNGAVDPAGLTRPVILKEARHAGEMEYSGADAVARLAWQQQLLTELTGDARFPAVLGRFELGTTHYLVMEEVPGPSLASWLIEHDVSRALAHRWVHELVSLVDALHERGVAWCDLSPDNVILAGTEQRLCAADLEHAVRADGPPVSMIGTPGYYPRALHVDADNQHFARDIYAIGAVIHTLWTDSWFRDQSRSPGAGWDNMWKRHELPAECPPAIANIIARATALDTTPIDILPAARPYHSLIELRDDLAAYAAAPKYPR